MLAACDEAPVIRDTHDAIAAHTGEALSPEDAQPAQAIVDESHAVLERPLGTIRPGDEHEPDAWPTRWSRATPRPPRLQGADDEGSTIPDQAWRPPGPAYRPVSESSRRQGRWPGSMRGTDRKLRGAVAGVLATKISVSKVAASRGGRGNFHQNGGPR